MNLEFVGERLSLDSRMGWGNDFLVCFFSLLNRKIAWFPNHWALCGGWTMKKNALLCKAVDSEVKQMHILGTEWKK